VTGKRYMSADEWLLRHEYELGRIDAEEFVSRLRGVRGRNGKAPADQYEDKPVKVYGPNWGVES
jgi:hypothetical protein